MAERMPATLGDAAPEVDVLVHAPIGRDARLLEAFLRESGMRGEVCASVERFLEGIAEGRGPGVIAEEALSPAVARRLLRILDEQPTWSDVPLVILGGRNGRRDRLRPLVERGPATVLRRPVEAVTLRTVMRAAVRARRRQLDERTLLDELQTLNEQLAKRTAQLQKAALELTAAELTERRRLADVLHDHLQQTLVAAKFQIDALRRYQPPELLEPVERVAGLLDESVRTSRSLAADLSPPFLQERSVGEALAWVARRTEQQHGVRVETSIRDPFPELGEKMKLLVYDCARELLFNAVKHSGAEAVRLELGRDRRGGLRLGVEDRGSGFDPSTELPGDGGTGLVRIRERVDYLGGTFEIASRPGRGTRAEVSLPRETVAAPAGPDGGGRTARGGEGAATDPTATRPGERRDRGRIRVLLADDHTLVRQGLSALLNAAPDIEVVDEAADGREAVELAERHRPDVVLMDVSMPEMDGIEATRRIVGERTCGTVVALSMHDREDVAARMIGAGARAYLAKDEAVEQLVELVRRFGRSREHEAEPEPPAGA